MKLCAVVVWYNPSLLENGRDAVANIQSYAGMMDCVFIVDNSSSNNSLLAKQISNARYIANLENAGIAKALNQGCQLAIDEGFEWCMTMDQDSYWNPEQLALFIHKIADFAQQDSCYVSFAPDSDQPVILSYAALLKRKVLGNHYEEKIVPPKKMVEEAEKVITSGNIIKLSAWQDVGCFLEPLFIDEVDIEFCFRLRRNGYKLLLLREAHMYHNLGSSKRTILPKITKHSGKRLYFIVRNRLIMMKLYPEYTNNYKNDLKIYFKECCIFSFDFAKNLFYFIKGFLDSSKLFSQIKNKEGKIM
ncbi:MAG: glycosyltransferase [Spirochaetaceae bacterium]|nr:glycosyltransferase [Spirochaetaceae bacterium]